MKLLVLCLLFSNVVTMTTGSNMVSVSSVEDANDAKRAKRALCIPGTWCRHGGRQYMFVSDPKQWAFAQLYCQSQGGTLAAVQNRETNDFLRILSSRMDTWIGFSDAQHNGVWLWINGERMRFTHWCRGEPNNHGGNQDCAVINYKGENCWDDAVCTIFLPYICERK